MELTMDLHLHSKFARGCSKDLDLEHLVLWGEKKGLDVIGTADYTHPAWQTELKTKLEDDGSGFHRLRPAYAKASAGKGNVRFVFSCELSSIYSRGGRVRRIHYVILLPNLAAVERFTAALAPRAKLASDGRPILGLDAELVARMALEASERALIIPAHIWTPWFSLFGSMSGFDSIEEAFGDLAPDLAAVETGISSDPAMNWRLSQLDRYPIVSFSDAHSPQPHRIGREATIFELAEPTYDALWQALRAPSKKNHIASTIEFYPEEGRYHYDGHRVCGVSFSPTETRACGGRCPVCGRPVTIGVLSRIEALADRAENFVAPDRPPFRRVVPLTEVITAALGLRQPTAKKVMALYETLIQRAGNELAILIGGVDVRDAAVPETVIKAIEQVRRGELKITPGYDGQYGRVELTSVATVSAQPLFQ